MYTERGRQWREVEQFTEENQEILQEGCKACVTHLTRVTNVMWTHQEHRQVCFLTNEHTRSSTDVTRTQGI